MRALKYALGLAALAAAGGAANAATTFDLDVAGGTGTFTHTAISSSSFDDTFTFFLPTPTTGSASVTSTAVLLKGKLLKDVTFTTATFNGDDFDGSYSGALKSLSWFGDLNYGSTANVIHLIGTVSGGSSSYSGQIEFVPLAAVPEPATWAMMIGGIGLAGGMLRRRLSKSEEAFTAKVRSIAFNA